MIDYTANIKNKMHTSDDSFERLQMIKNKYLNKTAYIVSAGPSLKNYNIDKLKFFLKDKFVIAVKQVYDLLQEVVDIHVLNFDNYKPYTYVDNSTIVNFIVNKPSQPYYILSNNIPCDFMLPLTRNHSGHENTIAARKDFDSLDINKSFERPWGSGIMYESAIPLALYGGVSKIITLGWDIGTINPGDEGKTRLKYDHFYAEGKDGYKTEYSDNVIRTEVGGSAGMGYNETKMVIDSTEDLYKYFKSINVELNIVSDRNPAHESIPRLEISEIL